MRVQRILVVGLLACCLLAPAAFSQESSASGKRAADVATAPKPATPSWGTSAITYYTVAASEFLPKDSTMGYATFVSPMGRYSTSSGAVFQAGPHIPGGALLTYLEFDFCDSDPSGSLELDLSDCDYLGICNYPPMASIISPFNQPACGTFAWTDLTPLNYTVNNYSRRLVLEILTGTGGVDKSFYGAVIGYRLQVSQPPGSPTFNDVPTNDLGYQYIEALAASGITGGCGGGNYCPDSAVTRRQMAIFIAKALGLSWSGF